MPVPSFPEVGKKLRSLFDEGYPFGLFKLNTRGTTCSKRQYCIDAFQSFDADAGLPYFEASTRKKYPSWGLSYVSKFNTKGISTTDIYFRTANFLLGLGGDVNVDTQEIKQRGNIQLRNEYLTVDLKSSGGVEPTPTVLTGSFICGMREYLTGIQLAYDVTQGSIISQNALIGYRNCGVALTAAVNNMDTLVLGFHYRPTITEGSLETGLLTRFKLDDAFSTDSAPPQPQAITETEGGAPVSSDLKPSEQIVTQFGVKYQLDPYNTFRAKADSNGMIGIAQDIKVKDEVTLTLGLLINGQNFWEGEIGGHKVGMALDFKG